MEKLNLSNYYVEEMQIEDLAFVNGGNWWYDFKTGFVIGWNAAAAFLGLNWFRKTT